MRARWRRLMATVLAAWREYMYRDHVGYCKDGWGGWL